MKKLIQIILLFSIFVGNIMAQDVPRVISYQGVLVDESGKPEDGSVDILFGLQNLEGAEHIDWIEERKGIQIRGGIFHVFLGDSSTPKGFPILHGDYALTIKVGNNTPYPVQLGSVPYALHALVADSLLKVIDSVRSSFKAEIAKFADSARASSISDTTKMKIPSGVPLGTIVAYYGEIANTSDIPDGWLLCDGSTIPAGTEYEALRIICSRNGHGGKTPDLRGQFLRGAGITFQNPNNNPDPDFTSRNGGSGTFKIGSWQPDAFQQHGHAFNHFVKDAWFGPNGRSDWPGAVRSDGEPNPGVGNGDMVNYPKSLKGSGEISFSSETRPKNVYVNYIIKAR